MKLSRLCKCAYQRRIVREIPDEIFEDAKGVIRSCKSKKYRQYHDQRKSDKNTNNSLQDKTQ